MYIGPDRDADVITQIIKIPTFVEPDELVITGTKRINRERIRENFLNEDVPLDEQIKNLRIKQGNILLIIFCKQLIYFLFVATSKGPHTPEEAYPGGGTPNQSLIDAFRAREQIKNCEQIIQTNLSSKIYLLKVVKLI